jgi:hypothetical protein
LAPVPVRVFGRLPSVSSHTVYQRRQSMPTPHTPNLCVVSSPRCIAHPPPFPHHTHTHIYIPIRPYR